jgi:formate-dependent nitrite reductase membrane component NrfD
LFIVTETVITRSGPLAEPVVWGWQVPVDLFLAGAAAGVLILTFIVARRIRPDAQSHWMRWAPFLAPMLLSGAMLALLLDLENKAHAFRFYTALRITSPMSVGAWIIAGTFVAAVLLGIARLKSDSRIGSWARRKTAILEIAGLVFAFGLAAYPGALLCSMKACAAWGSAVLVPLFLASGILTGGAFILLCPIAEEECRIVRRWVVGAVGAELFLLALYFLDLTTSGAKGEAAAALFLGGSYTGAFWAFVVIAGLLVPLGFLLMEIKRRLPVRAVTPVLLLAGAFALRWILVRAGQVS